MHESTPASDPFEFLKAQAIVIRMYSHYQTSGGTVVINNSTEKQNYIPNRTIHSRAEDAFQQTEGILLTYQDKIINAMYSSDHGLSPPAPNHTKGANLAYIKSVYDPAIGVVSTPLGHGWGMAQIAAKHWAEGDSQGVAFPQWNYLQILVHY